VWDFYSSHARYFVQDFGLMPGLVDELGLEGSGKRLFLARLCEIHDVVLAIKAEALRRARKEK
jgi:hypothetical protein